MKLYPIVIFIAFFSVFISCVEDDNFSSSPNLRLSFSNDTISFDTVFTEVGSSRKTLMVYNENKNSVNISSIKVMNPQKSGFSLVVDGVSGVDVKNTEILKKDSAYIYIMVKIDPNNANNPIIVSDSIQFEINGQHQYVHLEAFGQDIIRWRGKTIESDTTLTGEKPILVFDSLVIDKGATLTLKENVRIFFHNGAKVEVLGNIYAKGTIEQPVVFRGDRTDRIFTHVPYDRIPGQWEGMFVDSLSFNNHFENFHLRNSIIGIQFNPSNLSEQKALLRNTIIHNTQLDLISAENCDIKAENSLFTNSGGMLLKVVGGKYEFLHCTFANYIRWIRGGGILSISNKSGTDHLKPLIKCEFTNSIISGNNSTVSINKADEVPLNYLFNNCLFSMGGQDDENFIDSIWRENPKFKFISVTSQDNYYYNFELDSDSPAKDKGDLAKAFALPYDILGNSRLSDQGPDIGCYEWVTNEY